MMPVIIQDGYPVFHSNNLELKKCTCGCEQYKLIGRDDSNKHDVFYAGMTYQHWTEFYMKMTELEAHGKIKS